MKLKQDSLLQGGRYRIEKVLGQGGFGITYVGVHTLLDNKVAIKEFFMKDLHNRDADTSQVSVGSVGSSELVERFRQKFIKEARNIFRLKHGNIISVTDVFEENGTAYYVMDYISGGSLGDLVKSGPLSEGRAVRYIRQVASALDYVHSNKIMHLDVKPGNILLDEEDNAVLIDFGLAKQYDDAGSQTSSTPVGISHGYAPLEQYKRGGVSNFSPATDIYSLGATLYKLVTGVTPPEASDVNDEGLPPFPQGVSASVRAAIEAAMQSRRKDRPQSIAAFLEILDGGANTATTATANVGRSEETQIIGAVAEKVAERKAEETEETLLNPEMGGTLEFMSKAVDLGLSVKWASCNVGATKPEEYGGYYAWGETEEKSDYSWATYKWCKGTYDSMTKYCMQSKYGTVDNKRTLDPADDVAHVKWGGKWRVPTLDEIKELYDKCKWEWTTLNGVNGYRVTGPNGNSIFLPAAGYRDGTEVSFRGSSGYYWSCSLGSDFSYDAYYLNFYGNHDWNNCYRYFGHSVRPVCE